MTIERPRRPFRCTTALLVSLIALSGCNPGLYKKPAEDFRTASTALEDTYFLEWELSNRATIERGDLEDQIAIWLAPSGVSSRQIESVTARMTERRQTDIHEQLRPLREQAFNVMHAYANTLVSLSSDEPTQRIQSELTGLIGDVSGALEGATKLGADAEAVQKFAGPLQQYVGVLNEIIGLIASVLREQAIVETIGRSNESIVDLLTVLKGEAKAAEENALRQTREARVSIERFSQHDKFQAASNDLKATVAQRTAELKTIEQQILEQDIAALFDAAIKAQGALVEKAVLDEPGDWTLKITRFKEQVITTQTAIVKIRAEM